MSVKASNVIVNLEEAATWLRTFVVHNGSSKPSAPQGADRMAQRFIQLSDVSETLNISSAQAYALVRSGELNAIKVGGRGQWRVGGARAESHNHRTSPQTTTVGTAPPGRPRAQDRRTRPHPSGPWRRHPGR